MPDNRVQLVAALQVWMWGVKHGGGGAIGERCMPDCPLVHPHAGLPTSPPLYPSSQPHCALPCTPLQGNLGPHVMLLQLAQAVERHGASLVAQRADIQERVGDVQGRHGAMERHGASLVAQRADIQERVGVVQEREWLTFRSGHGASLVSRRADIQEFLKLKYVFLL